jgi:hypothetical protein
MATTCRSIDKGEIEMTDYAIQFAEGFQKFKEAKPEFKTGFTGLKLAEWHAEFTQKFINGIRIEAMTEAVEAVEKLLLSAGANTWYTVGLSKSKDAILAARDKIK